MKTDAVLDGVIIGYRKVIEARYQYENISNKYDLPASFDENRVELFRNYFLDYVYPDPDKRDELNEAFQSLDSYIKQPDKLLRLLLDSTRILFKFGRHVPKILTAGLKALKSFRTASDFENKLVQKAIAIPLEPPYDEMDINALLGALSSDDVDQFIEDNEALFQTLYDRDLVAKITEVVAHLVEQMKKRPNIYSTAEVNGLEIGLEIIQKGNQLFEQLNEEEQRLILTQTIQIERDALEGVVV